MCNLFASTLPQDAMRSLFKGLDDLTGNLPMKAEVDPDQMAPVIRNARGGRELAMARWGLPTPPKYLEGKKTDKGVTNVPTPIHRTGGDGWTCQTGALSR